MQRLASPAPRLVILQYAVVFFERMHEGVHSDTYQHELAKTQQRKMENTGVTWAKKQKDKQGEALVTLEVKEGG